MVTKVTVKGKREFHIVIPGAEAEYVAIINALTIGIGCINEDTPQHIYARKTLSSLLVEMLPGEENVIIPAASVA